MTSIHTNSSATAALRTLTLVNAALAGTQSEVATGLRVAIASDNAAYWSISTTMRSDNLALSTVQDTLGLTAAIADTAYMGLDEVGKQLSDFQAKLIAAKEPGVDKAKVQSELDQIKSGIKDAIHAASFNGVNWLDTDMVDVADPTSNFESIPWSVGRMQDGDFNVVTSKVVVGALSLFNNPKGGLLKADAHDLAYVGGLRTWGLTTLNADTLTWNVGWQDDNAHNNSGSLGVLSYKITAPLTFSQASDKMSFNITVDKDNGTDVPSPLNPGKTTHIVIDRATVDAALPSAGGVISNNRDFSAVLDLALRNANAGASSFYYSRYADDTDDWEDYAISTNQNRSTGLTGSYVEISNFTSNVGAGGLFNASDFGSRGSTMTIPFSRFEDFKDPQRTGGVAVDFDFHLNTATKHYSFDRTYVNATLGKDNGQVETADEMVTLLQSLLGTDYPHLLISTDGSGQITLKSDNNFDRLSGSDTNIGFNNIVVSNEPRSTLDLESIDIAANPSQIDTYIKYVNLVSQNVTEAAATVGALQKNIALQSDFVSRLKDTIDKGIGRLVDADMNAASARQKALQTQQQLAIQSLQIANAQSASTLSLFR